MCSFIFPVLCFLKDVYMTKVFFSSCSDPNLPENDGISTYDRGSSPYFSDDKWPKYNASHQQYLHIGRSIRHSCVTVFTPNIGTPWLLTTHLLKLKKDTNLIWIFTVNSNMSVRMLRVNTLCSVKANLDGSKWSSWTCSKLLIKDYVGRSKKYLRACENMCGFILSCACAFDLKWYIL